MRAFAIRSFGEPPSVHDLPVPAADGTVLIRVRAAGVNPLDSNLLGRLTAASSYPFVVGIDFAGVAERVPAGDHGLQAGDRVFGMARTHGSYAEYTAAAPGATLEPVARIPDGVTDDQAAALPIPATTALRTIDLLEVTAGQQVVVMGATGGVGGYAVQMARARGAHVIATVRGDADEARRLGAEEVYDSQAGDVIAALRAAHPDGVDAVLDLVNGPDAIHGRADARRRDDHRAHPVHRRPGRRRADTGRTPPWRAARQGRHPPLEAGRAGSDRPKARAHRAGTDHAQSVAMASRFVSYRRIRASGKRVNEACVGMHKFQFCCAAQERSATEGVEARSHSLNATTRSLTKTHGVP
jgi:NADPH2:quinone reductase